ncbi:MAG: hypothetical protein K0U52_00315 [Gammaproteobacteria bacterium]|nr:hypothetical protein [Gammaproteobacteria bacterium]
MPYAAGAASTLFGAGISMIEYLGVDIGLSSIAGSTALAGYNLFSTAEAMGKVSAREIPADSRNRSRVCKPYNRIKQLGLLIDSLNDHPNTQKLGWSLLNKR